MSIFPLLVVAFLFLLRGNYAGFVVATAIFQIYSILDGCDGEIARAKNLVSERGRRLDTFCDVFGNLLLVIGLGFGLQKQYWFTPYGWLYLPEGILSALFIASNELLLHSSKAEPESPATTLTATLYQRHRGLVQRSGLLFFGEKTVWWLMQLTKRDVAILFFLFLAIVGLPQWILHLSIVVAAASLVIAGLARLNSGRGEIARIPPS